MPVRSPPRFTLPTRRNLRWTSGLILLGYVTGHLLNHAMGLVSLAFAVAASANFPALILSMLWKDCTTRGAMIGGFLGLISSVGLTIVSPSVWEGTFGNPAGSALFPYSSPALFSMTIGFLGVWFFSITDTSARAKVDRAGFPAQQVRSETGLGASGASGH